MFQEEMSVIESMLFSVTLKTSSASSVFNDFLDRFYCTNKAAQHEANE